MILAGIALAAALAPACGTRAGTPANYVFFSRDHEDITNLSFTRNPGVAGAQLTYFWKELEPAPGRYNFDDIEKRLTQLSAYGKRLWIQFQDVTFSSSIPTPEYLQRDTAYHGGIARKMESDDSGKVHFGGWVARRWDPKVRERIALLMTALAARFDGRIEGINFAESSVGFEAAGTVPPGFTAESYLNGVRQIAASAHAAFKKSCVVTYANFMPGGVATLRALYAAADSIGFGVGGPDILPFRPFQRSNSLGLIPRRAPHVVGAMAVQDGNLADRDRRSGARANAEYLHAFAKDSLRLDYVFWGTEEPYYHQEVLPLLNRLSGSPSGRPGPRERREPRTPRDP